MSGRRPGLRGVLSGAMAVLAALALLASVSLVVLTTILHGSGASLSAAVESVHLAEGAEVDLFLHQQSKNPLVRTNLAGDLQGKLVSARAHVTTPAEGRVLDEAVEAAARYLESPDSDALATEAFAALERLVDINLMQADTVQARTARWDEIANALGIAVGLAIMLTTSLVIWWLRVRALTPVLELREAMKRFARGDETTRARPSGPTELYEIQVGFNEMADALTRQREGQATFLASMAHDLRNPLNALRLSADMVPDEGPLPPEPQMRKVVQRVKRQIVRIDRLVAEFEDRARIEAGALRLQPERHDVREVAQVVGELFEGVSSVHEIQVSVPDQPVWAKVDPLRMEQVVTNLVSNAIKYSPEGGRVEIAVAPQADDCVLAVGDQGVGMSREELELVFQPYHRGERLAGAVPGTGLGLANVRRIVEAHRGRIEVRSAPGGGSRFEVHLPVA